MRSGAVLCMIAGLLASVFFCGQPTAAEVAPLNNTEAATTTAQQQYHVYDYQENTGNTLKQVRLVIPAGLTTVQGILVVSCPGGGDTRDWYTHVIYSEFLQLHDFAFLGTQGFDSKAENVPVMLHAIQQFAKDANHPELVNTPFATTGFSSGAGYASRLLVELPERVIACIPICARLNFTGVTPNEKQLGTPACIISGETEHFGPVVDPVLAAYRPQGALFGWMTVQGAGHGLGDQEVLAMPMLEAALRLRYPADADVRKGPVTLKTVDPNSGWVADNTSWKSGLTVIAPAKDFKGELGRTSWLLNEDIAFIYRAYATYDKPLSITQPDPSWWVHNRLKVWDTGADITIAVDDTKFTGWTKLEFYDGAKKIGEVTQGPPQCIAKNLAPGYHAFSVLGTDGQGNVRTSHPVLVIVRKMTRPLTGDQSTTLSSPPH